MSNSSMGLFLSLKDHPAHPGHVDEREQNAKQKAVETELQDADIPATFPADQAVKEAANHQRQGDGGNNDYGHNCITRI